MRTLSALFFATFAALLWTLPAAAQKDADKAAEPPPGGEEIPAELLGEDGEIDVKKLQEALEAKLQWKTGDVELSDGLAKIKLPEGYRYLDPADSAYVLENLWGNPPGPPVLGMLFPSDIGPLSDNSWGVVIEYNEEGYVDDDEAEDIDYDDMLKDMKTSTAAENEMRKEQGYPVMDLIGWAEPPHYDKQAKKLYWAKELHVQGADENTLNYDIRVLGRRGFLLLGAVSTMGSIKAVKTGMQDILTFVEFNDGHRYADFDPELDKVAAYGVGALVAGKLAAKTGLFAGLIAVLLKAKKLLILGAVGLVALVGKIFGSKKD